MIVDFSGGVSTVGKKRGFASSSSCNGCQFRKPNGVLIHNDIVYVCDTGNHCIRTIKSGEVLIVAGNPSKCGHEDGIALKCELNHPSDICGNNSMAFFIDDNKIKSLSFDGHMVNTIYESDNDLVSIASPDEGKLFIMEEVRNG
jgi:hypothetical protein